MPSGRPFQLLGDASGPSAAASVSLDDTGTAADALSVAAAVPLTDTGAETDALAATAAVPLTEVGAETDALTATAAVPLGEVGAAADSLSVVGPTDSYQAWPQFEPRLLRPSGFPFQLQGDRAAAPPDTAAITLDDTGTGTDALEVNRGTDANQARPQTPGMFFDPDGASFQLQGDTSTGAYTITLTGRQRV